ncbi:Uncharacterized conserved protein [Poseidonocella pacifica]|uniref:Uncharacterized conserved protein n=1 Tax=Poseidonocella pacifica TaxID=871651 RepID=A0A1I0XZY7_9RHOB|nr:Uncharacterized conserved protein [Poseidonocella pacifica]
MVTSEEDEKRKSEMPETADSPETDQTKMSDDPQAEEPDAGIDTVEANAEEPQEDTYATSSVEAQPDADEPVTEDQPADEETLHQESTPVPEASPTATAEKRGGFVPALIGGVLAAAIGFGAAYWGVLATDSDDGAIEALRAEMAEKDAAIESLRTDLAGQTEAVQGAQAALGDATAATTASVDEVSTRVDGMAEALSALDDRLTALEKRPIEESVSPEAIAAYEREIDTLRASVSEQRAEFEALLTEARETRASAEDTAQQSSARAALGEIRAAIDAGAPFAGSLAEYEAATGESAPEALAVVSESGPPTLAALQASFPDAARGALAAARAGATEESGSMRAFFEKQLGARSIQPRDGDDPDAVLSRAEAELRSGALQSALSELDALPEAAKSELSDWIGQARTRIDALESADGLATQLTQD